jgi:nitrite reductase (NADH) large subunit
MKYVIIGGSAAGAQAAEDIRKLDAAGDITLVTAENYIPYSRCLLSRYVDGRLKQENMYFKTGHFFADNGVTGLINVRATGIDRAARTVQLSTGASLAYDRLLLATGAHPVLPKVPGTDMGTVFAFHDLDDAKKILHAAAAAENILVVGAGFAGLEAAYALTRIGKKVIVVERCGQILPNQLDPAGARIIQDDLERIGVNVVLNQSVRSLNGAPHLLSATLGDGSTLFCEVAVLATGIRPNKQLAEAAGLATDKGILVNEYMQTSDANIYAAGDAIEIQDVATGKRSCSATWFNAVLQGKYAACNMTGNRRRYIGAVGIQNAVQFHRIPAISFGLTQIPPEEEDNVEVMSALHGNVYRKLIVKDNRLCGMIFVGNIDRSGLYAALIRHGVDVAWCRDRLLDQDFNYAFFSDRENFGQLSPYLDTAPAWQAPDFWAVRAREVGISR